MKYLWGKSGYVVSIKKEENIGTFKIDLSNVKTLNDISNDKKKELKNFLNKAKSKYGEKLGFWYDKDNKEIVLDIVVVLGDFERGYYYDEKI
ncbi:hypothetical protein [Mycoplasma sp. Mirounga ES2805-ORL]|uniref:hypothetical protein n=1 Tax=Mycoplasma sp. Mirounga ES2805-ORL TaxID=754514 RepID=UPI00197C8C30|nr:hypothetical protein [Mycoplasma sp. Mirounga ES2805-ORL]QSF13734.1 hypothetical protein JXZ90_00325 [Mycoplasma sp. Mirounga ES2805-ORL]